MLEFIGYLPVSLALGAYKLPANTTIVGTKAVRNAKNGKSGVLIQHNDTGLYSIFSCGMLYHVNQKEAVRLAT